MSKPLRGAEENPPESRGPTNHETTLAALRDDPTLHFTDAGRVLLRWLTTRPVSEDDWADLADGVPSHTATLVADLARRHAANWTRFAERLENPAAIPGDHTEKATSSAFLAASPTEPR